MMKLVICNISVLGCVLGKSLVPITEHQQPVKGAVQAVSMDEIKPIEGPLAPSAEVAEPIAPAEEEENYYSGK